MGWLSACHLQLLFEFTSWALSTLVRSTDMYNTQVRISYPVFHYWSILFTCFWFIERF